MVSGDVGIHPHTTSTFTHVAGRVASPHKILRAVRNAPQSVACADLGKLCVGVFGAPRQEGTSHAVFKTPWQEDP